MVKKEEYFEMSETEETLKLLLEEEKSLKDSHFSPYQGAASSRLDEMMAEPYNFNKVWELIEGSIDVHIHAGPMAECVRVQDQLEMAIQGCRYNQAALVFKNAGTPTTVSARLVQKVVDQWAEEHKKKKIDILGGVVLNRTVGGLNPDTVVQAYKLGGKHIFLPSGDASHQCKLMGRKDGIRVIDENDKIVPELREILDLIAAGDMVLHTGHQSTKERFIIIDEARKMGVKRILVTHANYLTTLMTAEQAKQLADKGAYISIFCLSLRPPLFSYDIALEFIRTVGAEHIIFASDAGLFNFPTPIESFRLVMAELLQRGVPEQEIRAMFRDNPSRLIY